MDSMPHPSAPLPHPPGGALPATALAAGQAPAQPPTPPPGHAPDRPGFLGRLGLRCYRRRWLTLFAWIIGVACLITLWTMFGAGYDNNFTSSDPGQAVLSAHFPRQAGDQLTLAIRSDGDIRSPATAARVADALAPFRRAAGVTAVGTPYQRPGQISRDGHIAFATVQFAKPGADISNSEALALMQDARTASGHGVTFSLGGDVVDLAETPYGGPTDGIGVAAAAIVLLIAFGSLLAMSLPVVTALFGIGGGLSLIALIGHVIPAPSFSPIIASMIGLGVGVDYALFIVTRFREALRDDATPGDAVVIAMSTAGRSVLTAGVTVTIGMLGLLVLRMPLLNGVAVAASATVAVTVLGSLTLLPAMLGFTGTRLARPSRLTSRGAPGGRPPGTMRWARRFLPGTPHRAGPTGLVGPASSRGVPGGRPPGLTLRGGAPGQPGAPRYEKSHAAERWAAVIQRRPVIAAVIAAAAILALAAPALGMKLSMPDESAEARGTMGYATYATMAKGFGPGFDAPLIVAAALPPGAAGSAVNRLAGAVRAVPGVAAVTPPRISPDGRAAMIVAYPSTGEQNPATDTVVNKIISNALPRATAGTGIRAYLTGPNAANVAFANATGRGLPWLVAIVVAVSMVLLTAVFRSVTVAVKAALMNLLSISAAYGVLVLVTQHGWGSRLLGFPETMPVTTWVPIFLFVILFGLSMDYEVFLLSRIREAYDATGDNSASVARGLASSARVISAAAAIMVVVFASFVAGANVSVKQVGLGLAVAVLIDATLVRLVLVPAVMELLGKANWWLPRPLRWLGRPGPS